MKCLRCGKDVAEEQVFCPECLADMQAHPVNPNTPVLLPDRKNRENIKRESFQVAASVWEKQVSRLKNKIGWLIFFIILLLLLLILAVAMLVGLTPQWLNDWFGVSWAQRTVQNLLN